MKIEKIKRLKFIICSAQLVFKVTDRDELDKLVAGDSIHGLVALRLLIYGS